MQVWALVLTAWEMSSDATFRNLSTREARAVAQAIGGISSGAGKPLRVQPPTPPGLPPRFYQVIVPELELHQSSFTVSSLPAKAPGTS